MTPPLRSTRVEVDLDAIAANTRAVKAAAGGADVIAVVKADAYGHGAEAVGAAVLEAGAAMLAVFTVDEGIVLRRAIPGAPILVLLGPSGEGEADAAIAADLALAAWDVGRAKAIAAAARAAKRRAVVHVKVDTGLVRLGAPADEALARYRQIASLDGLVVEGVYSHLASPDETHDDASETQLARFRDFVGAIERPRWIHLAASAGVERFGRTETANAIRPGLALYGLHAAEFLADRIALVPALRWRSEVHRVRDVPRGTGVGYGWEFRFDRDGRVATVPVGYGDGLPRSARRGGLLVGGRRLPIAGRVAMDLLMLDASGHDVREGAEVVIIGEQGGASQTAEDVAAVCGTINYEVVTNIRPRVARVYRRGGAVVATKTLADGFRWL